MIPNIKSILKIIILTPIVWFATFGDNNICINFVYFFNFYICLLLFGYLTAFETICKNLTKKDISNDTLNLLVWLIPACLLIADGWLISGILWFTAWAIISQKNKELPEENNDKQNNDI